MSRRWVVGVFLLLTISVHTDALPDDGTECTGHARVVNATMLEVDCPPAVNTEYNIQGPLVEATWEFQSLKVGAKQTGCYRVVLYQNQSVVFYEKMIKSPDRVIFTRLLVNTSMSVVECDNSFMVAFNTTRSSTCCQYGYLQLLAVNPDNGSLILRQLATIPFAHHWANGKSATCSVTGSNGRTANSSFTIATQNKRVKTRPQYSKARPMLPAVSITDRMSKSKVKWHAGSSGILCVVVTGGRETRSKWSHNGLNLGTAEVSIATEDCVDCRQDECIREAERKAGLSSTHRPVAIVGKWETPCFGGAPTTISLMSFVRVPNATLRDSGDYIIKFERNRFLEFSHLYNVTVDWLRETSFFEEPSSELTVREGDTLQVPCVINTAVDTNLSQVYWSGPQGLIAGISFNDADNRPEMACQQNSIADRVFYIQMATRVSSDGGILAQISLNLHVCDAEQQDSGVYRCGVWTGNGRREFKSIFLTVEVLSTRQDYTVAAATLCVVMFVLLVTLVVLVVLLCWCACQSSEKVQHVLYRMHLRSMPPTNASPGSLLPHTPSRV